MITKTKQWGNSLAVIIPRDIILEQKLKPNEEVDVQVLKKANVLKELFGALEFSKPTEQILKEARKNTCKWD